MSRKSNGAGLARAHSEAKRKRILNPAAQRTAALAGAATIGAGAVAAGLLAIKGPLGRLARNTAVEVGMMVEHLSFPNLLSLLGLQKKRAPLALILPSAGMMVAGVAIGSLGGIWFATTGALDGLRAIATRQGIDRVTSNIETSDTSRVADEAR
jgi:hypothetical protein